MNQQLCAKLLAGSVPPASMELKLILAGLGGQGVIFTTRLLAQTAVALGQPVMVSEVHGMSQRGGSVVSHLKIGGSEAPLIRRGTADLLLALDPDEAVRNLSFLRRGGVALVNTENSLLEEVTEHLERLEIQVLFLPASRLAVELGSAAVTNVVLVGFAVAHPFLPLSIDTLRETLVTIASRGRGLNLRALEVGYRAGCAHFPLPLPLPQGRGALAVRTSPSPSPSLQGRGALAVRTSPSSCPSPQGRGALAVRTSPSPKGGGRWPACGSKQENP